MLMWKPLLLEGLRNGLLDYSTMAMEVSESLLQFICLHQSSGLIVDLGNAVFHAL